MNKYPKIICMIPARMGSQRLKQKNLLPINGVPLIKHTINKAKKNPLFDEIWVNSEHEKFKDIATQENVNFHRRPDKLANNLATSEDFVFEFMEKHKCEFLIQLHTIAPLLNIETIKKFTKHLYNIKPDVQFSVVLEKIECMYNGHPINFTNNSKNNSQDIKPIQRITWSITGWNVSNYMKIYKTGKCATYAGKNEFFPINREEGIIIKKSEDLSLVNKIIKGSI